MNTHCSATREPRAIQEGWFKDEIVPVGPLEKGTRIFDTDEHPRSDTTLESLAKLRPTFKKAT